MKKQIRNRTFETNSSSVHSLSIDKSGRRPSVLRLNSNGEVVTRFGVFGKFLEYYSSQHEKLSYLITCCKYISRGWDIESIYDTYEFKKIRDVLIEYIPGCTGLVIEGDPEDGEIDHQSQPEYGTINIINVYDDDEIIDFIFNDYVSLKTDCD